MGGRRKACEAADVCWLTARSSYPQAVLHAQLRRCQAWRVDPVVALKGLGGYATRAGLVKAGVTRHAVYRALDAARIVRIRRGVYGVGLPDGTSLLAAASTALRATVSHDSAAVLWDLEMAHQPGTWVSVPRNRSRAAYTGVKVRRARVDKTAVRHGLRVTTPLRTVLDCARELSISDAVVIADSAMRKNLVTIEELRAAAAAARGRRAGKLRRVAALADPRCGSVLESLLRVLLVEAGVSLDRTQWTIRDDEGHFVAVVDFAWLRARLIVEADGFEFHSERSDYRKDRRRANAYCRCGWRLLRFTWEDIRLEPDYVVEAVRHELAKPLPQLHARSTSTQRAA
jgi:very-short-patch-repair endonuclease